MTHAYAERGPETRMAVVPRHTISWGAILAGFVIAVAIQLLLTVLGAAIGLTALQGENNPRAFGTGAIVWAVVVPLIALFVGGMTAGQLSHVHSSGDALLHGALVWALTLLLALWMLGTGLTRVLGGTLSFAGQATSGALAGVGAAASRPGAERQAQQRAEESGLTREELQQRLDQARAQASQAAERAQSVAAGSAWGVLAGLVLSLIAAVLGARTARHEPHAVPA